MPLIEPIGHQAVAGLCIGNTVERVLNHPHLDRVGTVTTVFSLVVESQYLSSYATLAYSGADGASYFVLKV